ncbi:adenylosuccinate lyase [Frigidibacter sp.]|uniref:adenylosuccinate lyase n=1 Tax=Frigidibacter sp. TaxID=2586418 RepID=UPI0027327AB1|nr:adenylosuccinate lyase [Frigidibacter sp.]MDP3339632.1 adenylosuccinate lyase [Frigidibacter sp.]
MTTRALTTTLAALCLSLLPMAASAAGCGHDEARMSCATGTAWDEATKACIATTS